METGRFLPMFFLRFPPTRPRTPCHGVLKPALAWEKDLRYETGRKAGEGGGGGGGGGTAGERRVGVWQGYGGGAVGVRWGRGGGAAGARRGRGGGAGGRGGGAAGVRRGRGEGSRSAHGRCDWATDVQLWTHTVHNPTHPCRLPSARVLLRTHTVQNRSTGPPPRHGCALSDRALAASTRGPTSPVSLRVLRPVRALRVTGFKILRRYGRNSRRGTGSRRRGQDRSRGNGRP
jgi:hypothetical protein